MIREERRDMVASIATTGSHSYPAAPSATPSNLSTDQRNQSWSLFGEIKPESVTPMLV